MVHPVKICVVANSELQTHFKCGGCGKIFTTRDEKLGFRLMKIHMEKTHQAVIGNTKVKEESVEEIARKSGVNSSKAKVVRY